MLRTSAALTVVLAALLLSGCAQLFPARGEPASSQPTVDEIHSRREAEALSNLLDFYRRSASMAPEELARRLDVQRKQLDKGRCDDARLRSAILVSRLPAHKRSADAEHLLGPCLEDPFKRYSDKGGLAMALHDLLITQVRAEEQANAAEKLAEAKKSLSEENAKLRKQLDGLKAIERSIQQRDKSSVGE